jgi:hypothetical protein
MLWRLQYSWLLVALFTRVVATSAFIPIVKVMFEAMDCTHTDHGFVWSVDSTVLCWRGESFALGIIALGVLLVYVPLCARFFKVGRKGPPTWVPRSVMCAAGRRWAAIWRR